MKSLRRCTALLTVMAVLCAGGCASVPDQSRGRKAEQAGDYAAAYDAYCEAARDQPASTFASAAIRRVAPLAARDAEQRAHTARDEGRMIEAWRLFMRVLEIQPDHPSAAQLIRRIERDYPADTRRARARWERGAFPADTRIATRKTTTRPQEETVRDDRVAVADAAPPDETNGAAPAMEGSEPSTRPAPKPTTTIPPVGSVPEPSTAKLPDAAPAPIARATPVAPAPQRQTPNPKRAPRPAPNERAQAYRFGVRHRVPPRPSPAGRSGYLTRAIISRDDKRYDDTVELADGIRVHLRDTDPDPLDADIEIRRGKKRIAKLKDVRRGRTIPVIGRSGRRYYVTIINIRDDTETVTIGLKPARSGKSRRR